MKPRLFLAALAMSLMCLAGGLFAHQAHAQLNVGMDEVGNTIKLPDTDPRIIAGRIINIALGVLGIILLAIILYAGFLWMTSGGDSSKIEKAQKMIRNAVIGLVIILMSWAIAYYVINVLLNATGGGGNTTGTGPGGCTGSNCFGGGGAGAQFRIVSASPQRGESDPINMDSTVDITFTMDINPDISKDWAQYVKITTKAGDVAQGSWEIFNNNGKWIHFTPADACTEDPARKCFPKNTTFYVTVDKAKFTSATKDPLSCGGLYPSCNFSFYVGDRLDMQNPAVTILDLYDYQHFCEDKAYIPINAKATDDFGISLLEWAEDGTVWESDGPSGATPKEFNATKDWSTVGKVPKQPYLISVQAKDTDSHTGSAGVHLITLKNHCCNKAKDADEVDVDCGGKDCLGCLGNTCTEDAQCMSGKCIAGICAAQPVITNVSPTSGRDGTFVSIWGGNFGGSGTTTFMGPPAVEAFAPSACKSLDVKSWTNEYILVEVPQGAQSGPIKVYNAASKLEDTTNDDRGPLLPDFTVNDVVRPGVCKIDPSTGKAGTVATLTGQNFGASQGERVVGFGTNNLISQTSAWSDGSIKFSIPNIYAASYWVGIKNKNGTIASNGVPFDLQAEPPLEAPTISSISPNHGPTGQYITIFGKGFGTAGLVIFKDKATGAEIKGDTVFPADCGNNWWRDNQIIVKVPTMVDQDNKTIPPLAKGSNPNFYVYIVRTKDNKASQNSVDFLYSNEPLGPGICRINPTAGPRQTVVQIYGEGFGSAKGANDKVFFNLDKESSVYGTWGTDKVDASVPDAAITGPLYVGLDNKPKSNEAQFAVGDCRDIPNLCTANQVCCPSTGACADGSCSASFEAMYGWEMSTGIIPRAPSVVEYCNVDPQPGDIVYPSPSPSKDWPGGDKVCTKQASMGIMFNMPIEGDSSDLNPKVKLMKCVGKGSDPCQERTEIAKASFVKQPTIKLNGNVSCSQPPLEPDCRDYLTFEPGTKLDIDSTYAVYVSSDIRSVGQYGDKMKINPLCEEPDSGYCYRFKTRSDDGPCEVGFVFMSPYTAGVEGGDIQDYQAMPVTKDAFCNLLSCKGFDWKWDVTWKSLQTSLAALAGLEFTTYEGKTMVSCHQRVKAEDEEASNPPVHVTAQEILSTKTGLGELYIQFLVPQIIDYSPNCTEACLNAYLWARFNTSLDAQTINTKNVQVFKCKNENCLETDLVGAENLAATKKFNLKLWPTESNPEANVLSDYFGASAVRPLSFITIDPRDFTQPNTPLALEANSYYLVKMVGGTTDGIKSSHGVPFQQTFTWKFRTASGEKALCKPDRIMVYPSKAIESRVGDRELFQSKVFSAPDECRSDGQMLLITNSFEWTFKDPAQQVAKYAPFPPTSPAKDIDADGVLPKGCSQDCRATGSDGRYGSVASCGNGLVETTDNKYCVSGKTLAGQNCKVLPMASGAGEQCDGNIDPNDATIAQCDAYTCLWKNTPVVNAGTCGNFVTDSAKGEMCDPGLRCFGVNQNSAIVAGAPCDAPTLPESVTKAKCEQEGGKCEIRNFNGCTAGCKNMGASSMPSSSCGNDNLGYGEDCDQGGANGAGGCSVNCLHVGSSKSVSSLCGNGKLEEGETCESAGPGEPVPAYCDINRCVKLGNQSFNTKFPPEDNKTCGNGIVDGCFGEECDDGFGEECDDGNIQQNDGCSAVCLREGSNWRYPGDSASLCGNGKVEKGETCEVKVPSNLIAAQLGTSNDNPAVGLGVGNGLVDPIQIGEIIGQGPLDPQTLLKQTLLNVAYQGVSGEAVFGIRCGHKSERECGANGTEISSEYGLDKDGCCSARPKKVSVYPAGGATNVCRNTLISVAFDQPMDDTSVLGNFLVAKKLTADTCPEGTTKLTMEEPHIKGFKQWIAYKWQSFTGWITGQPTYAAAWCAGMVSGQLTGSEDSKEFYYTLGGALDPNTEYIARFIGDDLTDNDDITKRMGIKSKNGTVVLEDKGVDNQSSWGYSWQFKTGDVICRLSGVLVEDLDENHPTYFQKAFEKHPFSATALTLHEGKVEKLSPVDEYDWEWWGWLSNSDIAETGEGVTNSAVSTNTVSAKDKNGSAIIHAGIAVTSDKIDGVEKITNEPQVVFGALPIMVFLCDNPWPKLSEAPFKDIKWSTHLGTLFANGPFFNFQTMYCRDGESLLPELETHQIPNSAIDQMQGILRQYLFTFKDPAFKHDGIGIRVMSNTYHDSLQQWYVRQGFVGSPQSTKVDGYEALRDAGTVYVGFPNTEPVGADPKGSKIYQNILVISHNLDSSNETNKIFDQLVSSLAFNINFEQYNTNTCVAQGKPVKYDRESKKTKEGLVLTKGKPLPCVSDWDCAVNSDTSVDCASFKYKLQRDLVRLKDFQDIKTAFKDYYEAKGYYPQLSEGTFLSGKTNSRWPSWQETLGPALGLGEYMPKDPINRFVSCGFCKSKDASAVNPDMPCTEDGDCPSDSYTCETKDGFDKQTCWDAAKRLFQCPKISGEPDSRFYSYKSFEGGRRFEFGANFEIPPKPDDVTLENWWYPSYYYQSEIKVCYTSSTISDGRSCWSDDDCKPCANPNDTVNCKAPAPKNSCRFLGSFKYNNICDNNSYGEGGTCGDKIIGSICYGGTKNGQACKGGDCPGGTCKEEACELGQTHPFSCQNGKGTELRVCDNCQGWVADPKITSCQENAMCGNGRIDKTCKDGDYANVACTSNADCKDANGAHDCVLALVGTPAHPEACDDGALNGTYGHCNSTCEGIDKFCGNGNIDPGERCDRGSGIDGNGAWCKDLLNCYATQSGVTLLDSCATDCQGMAPFCGDGALDMGSEECDGNISYTSGKICAGGNNINLPCQTDADCADSANTPNVCGGAVGSDTDTCENTKINRCATDVKICVAVSEAGDFDSATWFNMTHNYKLCNTDKDCGINFSCKNLSQAGGDFGGCKSDAQCQAPGQTASGKCNPYDTAHVRTCGTPGQKSEPPEYLLEQCKLSAWSGCRPMNFCGDGVIDQSEECDNGKDNADYKACTSTCKKNVCGDGNLWSNVEECDAGSNNGKQVCKADYQSTCNDCTLQCKNMTASGGYCGNGIKEAGEQCDGNEILTITQYAPSAMSVSSYTKPHYILPGDFGPEMQEAAKEYLTSPGGSEQIKVMKDAGTVTCKSLGFDFAINSTPSYAFSLFNPAPTLDNSLNGLFATYWGSETATISAQFNAGHPPVILNVIKLATQNQPAIMQVQDRALINTVLDACGLLRKEKQVIPAYNTPGTTYYKFFWKDSADWPSKEAFWNCIDTYGPKFGFKMEKQTNDKPSCNLNCKISGCGRCLDEVGTGTISGQVLRDSYGAGIGISGARVTLQYNGINIGQVMTDGNGYYNFGNLNSRQECANYRIIADKTVDNKYYVVYSKYFSLGDYSSKLKVEVCDQVNQCPVFTGLVLISGELQQ